MGTLAEARPAPRQPLAAAVDDRNSGTGGRGRRGVGVSDPMTLTLSDVERRQYAFEGGGAISERQPANQRGWLTRLFWRLLRGR
jgi:hypothetical protein